MGYGKNARDGLDSGSDMSSLCVAHAFNAGNPKLTRIPISNLRTCLIPSPLPNWSWSHDSISRHSVSAKMRSLLQRLGRLAVELLENGAVTSDFDVGGVKTAIAGVEFENGSPLRVW